MISQDRYSLWQQMCLHISPPLPPQCIVGSPDKANISGIFQIYLIPLLKLLYFSCKNYAEKQRDRQEQMHTIQGQVTTLYKWLLLMTENLLRKERYAPASQPGPLLWHF